MKPGAILLLGLLAGVLPRAAAAQTCTVNNPAGGCTVTVTMSSVTVPTLLALTISGTTATLTTPAIADFGADSTAHITDAAVTTVTARGNVGFHVTFRAGAATWSSTGTPPLPKPASDLAWGTSPGGPFTAISTTAATILSSATRSNAISATLSFRTDWHWIQNTTGVYSLPLVFTLVSP
ncbi:MAG: hypothetical protein ACHQXA_02510 [Gemmatimonadales bacterium]